MRINLTIRTMLILLVFFGALVILGLAAVSSYSNQRLINSHRRVTDIVIPLETANREVRVAMAEFVERQSRVIRAADESELDDMADSDALKTRYDRSRASLGALFTPKVEESTELRRLLDANQALLDGGEPDQYESLLAALDRQYAQFLQNDTAIFEAVRFRLKTDISLRQQIHALDEIGKALRQKAERVAGSIRFAAMQERVAVREYLGTETRNEELHSAVLELLKGDLSKPQDAVNDLRLGVAGLATHSREILLAETAKAIADIQETRIAAAYREVSASLTRLEESVGESERIQAVIAEIQIDFVKLQEILQEIIRLRKQWFEQRFTMTKIEEDLRLQTKAINEILSRFQSLGVRIREFAKAEANEVRTFAERIVWAAAFIAALLMFLVGLGIIRRIVGPIKHAVSFADTIAQGDLTARINIKKGYIFSRFSKNGHDEIGNLVAKLSEMAQSLNSLISQVQRSGVQVSSSSTQLAATARQQEVIMANQTASTRYVVKSLGEISEISSELVHTMQQVATMSGETAEFAAMGRDDLSRMEEAIRRMENASASISAKLEAINEKATNITSVVTTITKVADQTNLLSLNAAIEAEKAGEQGRGFTVVAREIRRLADQTAVATLDIEQMVKDMQSAVSAGVMEMDAFMKEVRHSSEDISRISDQLNRIIQQVETLSPSFDNVNKSMQTQSENAKKISEAMRKLGEDLQQTLDSLRESFLAIDQLNEAAGGLQDEVSRFKV